jgi:Dehydrogenases with different specificities (related to short-chain alcohol dehydrogenases)
MILNMEGLRVIITAGAGGIGRATALSFRAEGAKVFICDVSQAALDDFASEYPDIGACLCDVSDEANVAAMFKTAIDWLGGLDCLVNNAGSTGPTKRTGEISPDEWQRCVDVNLKGTYLCTHAALPHVVSSANPSIISLSSAAGRVGYPNKSPYVAAKWGIVGFMKTVSIEYGGQGVRCNAVLPGPVDNARMKGVIAEKAKLAGITPEAQAGKYLSLASIKKFVTNDEVADLIVFLASERARSISGQAIGIDGDLQALV